VDHCNAAEIKRQGFDHPNASNGAERQSHLPVPSTNSPALQFFQSVIALVKFYDDKFNKIYDAMADSSSTALKEFHQKHDWEQSQQHRRTDQVWIF